MKTLIYSLVLFISSSLAFIPNSYSYNYEEMLKDIIDCKPSTSMKFSVENMFFQKDQGTFEIKEGEFHVYNKINGKYCFAEFIGEGEFSMLPPILVERQQLERQFKSDFYSKKFTKMFIVFTDGFEDYLLQNAKKNNMLRLTNSYRERAMTLFLNKDQTEIHIQGLIKSLLESSYKPIFYALITNDEGDEFVWGLDEYDIEEAGLYKVHKSRSPSQNDYLNFLCQFHKTSDYNLPRIERENENKDEIKLDKYHIKVEIPKDLHLKAVTTLKFTSRVDGDRWLNFSLGPKLDITEISMNGKDIYYYIPENSRTLWVELDEELVKDKSYEIKFAYNGEVIERVQDWFVIRNFVSWYPAYGFYKKSQFELDFNTYHTYRFTSSGAKILEEENGDYKRTVWKVEDPHIHVAFNIGVFKEKEIEAEKGKHPDMLIHYNNSDLVDNVAIDLKQSYEFYTKIFGPISENKFFATEIPSPHGQAFPNFLHLSYLAFMTRDMITETYSNHAKRDDFFEQTLISHEMAHQWWGNVKTSRDAWVSEGFAEYSSMMYAQIAMNDKDLFFKILEKKREGLWRASQRKIPAGPVGLGTRLGGDYSEIVYNKGSWVLHMLRSLMLDLNKMDDQPFVDLMGGFFKKYGHNAVSTEDFIEFVNGYLGVDMQWFFDQWIYGYKMPLYKFAWKSGKNEKGTNKIDIRVVTEFVDDNFQMQVPIKIIYEDGTSSTLKIGVVGNKVEFPINVPKEVDEIEFNIYESVLCEVEYVDWD